MSMLTPVPSWGRWRLEADHLAFHPDPGKPNPEYEISTAALKSRRVIREWVERLTGKGWVTADDLRSFESACEYILNYYLVDESEAGAPAPMSWDDYRQHTQAQWQAFLSSADQSNESEFQRFLERYPNLLPGKRHHERILGVISQPELPGARPRRPDFLLFDKDSTAVYPVLIEIEAPAKHWCNNDAVPTATFTQALDQLREWKAWFAERGNEEAFRDLYGIDSEDIRTRRLIPQYVLIYGRRQEANRFNAFERKRSYLAGPDEHLMTYDRLVAYDGADLTLRLDRSKPDTHFRVINVPPTFILGKRNAAPFSRMTGREEAIRACSLMSEERRQFLLDRLPFADDYVRRTRLDGAW